MYHFIVEFAPLNVLPLMNIYMPSNTPMEEEAEVKVNEEDVANLGESNIKVVGVIRSNARDSKG